jgi:two-component system sensor histidine kinase KdpD
MANFFRKGNLSALRELALRGVLPKIRQQGLIDYREREGLEQAAIPEKVMVCIASHGNTQRLLRTASRIAAGSQQTGMRFMLSTPGEEPARIKP